MSCANIAHVGDSTTVDMMVPSGKKSTTIDRRAGGAWVRVRGHQGLVQNEARRSAGAASRSMVSTPSRCW